MNNGKKMIERITDAAQLQNEALPGRSIVELYSDRRVLIEVHRGILSYDTEKIQIRVKYGILCICGSCLEVTKMTVQQLVISGQIDSLHLIRGKGI